MQLLDFIADLDAHRVNLHQKYDYPNKQLNRFTLRGQAKVDGQWKLFALVHNIEKLAHHSYAQ